MKMLWFSILCLGVFQLSSGTLLKHLQFPKPGGIIDTLTKPKVPIPGFQTGIHIGTGSFGFGFGFGVGGQGSQGSYVPPNERPHPSWEEEEEKEIYPKPDREDKYKPDREDKYKPNREDKYKPDREDKYKPDREDKYKPDPWDEDDRDDIGPRPNWEDDINTERPKMEETVEEKYPDWEDIGEEEEKKSEDLMSGDLIKDGIIQPRLNRRRNRNKRFIESRVYHVPVMFRSNAKPFQVKVRSNSNSLEKGNLGI